MCKHVLKSRCERASGNVHAGSWARVDGSVRPRETGNEENGTGVVPVTLTRSRSDETDFIGLFLRPLPTSFGHVTYTHPHPPSHTHISPSENRVSGEREDGSCPRFVSLLLFGKGSVSFGEEGWALKGRGLWGLRKFQRTRGTHDSFAATAHPGPDAHPDAEARWGSA